MYNSNRHDDEEAIYSQAVKAGRRTYFFDVKATRGDEYYITITESRKTTHEDGHVSFDRKKLFLYKEDFAKFENGLADVIGYIKKNRPEMMEEVANKANSASIDEEFDKL